ncbi:MAG: hypothetical protein ACKOTE_07170, partial [Opitutaceae bacterium]
STTDNSDITDPEPPAFTTFATFLFPSARSLRSVGSAERPSAFIRAICALTPAVCGENLTARVKAVDIATTVNVSLVIR